jgi:hypothetical protein
MLPDSPLAANKTILPATAAMKLPAAAGVPATMATHDAAAANWYLLLQLQLCMHLQQQGRHQPQQRTLLCGR